jgi:hypothetical protein
MNISDEYNSDDIWQNEVYCRKNRLEERKEELRLSHKQLHFIVVGKERRSERAFKGENQSGVESEKLRKENISREKEE